MKSFANSCPADKTLNVAPRVPCTLRPLHGSLQSALREQNIMITMQKSEAAEITAAITNACRVWRELATVSINKRLGVSGRFAVVYWRIYKADRNAIKTPSPLLSVTQSVYLLISHFLTFTTFLSICFSGSQVYSYTENVIRHTGSTSASRLAASYRLNDIIRMMSRWTLPADSHQAEEVCDPNVTLATAGKLLWVTPC